MTVDDSIDRIPETGLDALWGDVMGIRETVGHFLDGALSEDAFRHFRVHRGIYSQRQPGVHMVRVRVPLGRLTACQARRLARLSAEYGSGKVHITTRQDVQLYFVPTPDVPDVIEALAGVGLTTRESGGSAARNVTVCPMAGICSEEHFDVTPIAEAVGRHFLRSPLVQNLPRKFKIAFSGCDRDCALAGINDAGFIANPGAKRSFRMVVAGGLGPTPEVAHPLLDEVQEYEAVPMAEAVVRVFDRLGDRTNRQKARLKFVVRRIGIEQLSEEILTERASVEALPVELGHSEEPPAATGAGTAPTALGLDLWKERAVVSQKQPGFHAVQVFVPRGDLTADELLALAEAADAFGNGTIRTTLAQGVVLPWVPEGSLAGLYQALTDAGLAIPLGRTVADVGVCPAAATCRLGVTRATNAANELTNALSPLAGDEDLRDVTVKMGGCPNSCAHHHLATIGLHGAASTVDGKKVPCYQVMVGGRGEGGVTLARRLAKVPARRLDALILRLIDIYRRDRLQGEAMYTFLNRVDITWLLEQVADLTEMRPREDELEFFFDIGGTEPFRVDTAEGECAA